VCPEKDLLQLRLSQLIRVLLLIALRQSDARRFATGGLQQQSEEAVLRAGSVGKCRLKNMLFSIRVEFLLHLVSVQSSYMLSQLRVYLRNDLL
jgi:hypothetical protein